MKIMVLSDLYWTRENIVTKSEFDTLTLSNLCKLSNKKVQEYYNIVSKESPDILVLAGDITGDGFCGHGHHYALCSLIKLLIKNKIIILLISGNHDEDKYYNIVLRYISSIKNVHDIAGKIHNFHGLKFFGIPYNISNSKTFLNHAIDELNRETVDFLIAHTDLKRRTHFFESKAKCIITGHFDNKLSFIDDRIFISHGNDWLTTNYSTIYLENNTIKAVKYFFSNFGKETVFYEEKIENLKKGNKRPILKQDNIEIDLINIENEIDNPFTYLALKAIKLNISEGGKYRDKELLKLESSKLHKILFQEHGSIKYIRGKNYVEAVEILLKAKKTQKIPKNELLNLTDLVVSSVNNGIYKFSKEIIKDFLGRNTFE